MDGGYLQQLALPPPRTKPNQPSFRPYMSLAEQSFALPRSQKLGTGYRVPLGQKVDQ